MIIELIVRNVFRLSNGVTVFACEGGGEVDSFNGCNAVLMQNGEPRQRITLVGEYVMSKKTTHINQRAVETRDSVALTLEDAQSGTWSIVCDEVVISK